MRRFVIAFLVLNLMAGGIARIAYAKDCTEDTVIDRFGDWFGNLGKSESRKQRYIATRKAHRRGDCEAEQSHKTSQAS